MLERVILLISYPYSPYSLNFTPFLGLAHPTKDKYITFDIEYNIIEYMKKPHANIFIYELVKLEIQRELIIMLKNVTRFGIHNRT